MTLRDVTVIVKKQTFFIFHRNADSTKRRVSGVPALQLGTLAEGATKTRELHMSKQFQFVKL